MNGSGDVWITGHIGGTKDWYNDKMNAMKNGFDVFQCISVLEDRERGAGCSTQIPLVTDY